uniref:Uncharacterized protein n=1 Tax=viral metagenome TaxID=1070528 RepID=A0A6M3LCM3_9ZZZZ
MKVLRDTATTKLDNGSSQDRRLILCGFFMLKGISSRRHLGRCYFGGD